MRARRRVCAIQNWRVCMADATVVFSFFAVVASDRRARHHHHGASFSNPIKFYDLHNGIMCHEAAIVLYIHIIYVCMRARLAQWADLSVYNLN